MYQMICISHDSDSDEVAFIRKYTHLISAEFLEASTGRLLLTVYGKFPPPRGHGEDNL